MQHLLSVPIGQLPEERLRRPAGRDHAAVVHQAQTNLAVAVVARERRDVEALPRFSGEGPLTQVAVPLGRADELAAPALSPLREQPELVPPHVARNDQELEPVARGRARFRERGKSAEGLVDGQILALRRGEPDETPPRTHEIDDALVSH
jgi:hypothetical protein